MLGVIDQACGVGTGGLPTHEAHCVFGEKNTHDGSVKVLLRDGASFQGLGELLFVVGGAHADVGAPHERGGPVLDATPVGDDGEGEAPAMAQDVGEQMAVGSGLHAVDEVVAGHQAQGHALLQGGAEVGAEEAHEVALGDDFVACLAVGLLALNLEVLEARHDGHRLDAAHDVLANLSAHVRVLARTLSGASATRVEAEVDAGREGHVLTGSPELLAHGMTEAQQQLAVPEGCHGDAGGEGGVALAVYAMRAVGHQPAGDAQHLIVGHRKERLARELRHLLLRGHQRKIIGDKLRLLSRPSPLPLPCREGSGYLCE